MSKTGYRYMAHINLTLHLDAGEWGGIVALLKREDESEGGMLVRMIEEKLGQELAKAKRLYVESG
jgi:hypothetical protein